MARLYFMAVCLLLTAALPPGARAQDQLDISEDARFHFVRLWNEEMIEWLDKENSPDAHACRRDAASFDAGRACIRVVFGSLEWTFALHERPDEAASEIGMLRISAMPTAGLTATFIPTGQSASTPLALDLAEGDFGYDFAHDVTLRGLDGEWVAIAVPVGAGIGWFQREPAPDVATGHYVVDGSVVVGHLRGLETDSIYSFGDRSVVLLGVGSDHFVVRDEQEPDMFCEMGSPPALLPYQAERLSWREAYDADGRLMLRRKYMRGC